jgi:hypothetical protein
MGNLRLVHSDSWFEESNTGSPSALEPRCGEITPAIPALDPAVQAMVERVRVVVSLPPTVRARALARARAVVAALRR